jgi:hypothetical protein
MEANWESMIAAVELGHVHAPASTAAEPSGPVPGDSRELVVPSYKGSIIARSMGPERATAGPLPKVRWASSTVDSDHTIVLDDSALSPHSRVELPSLGVVLGSARFQCTWQAHRPQGIAHLFELQLSGEPKRIWSKVSLGLLDCALDQPGIHSMAGELRVEHSEPEVCNLVPEIPGPNMQVVDRLSPEGLPAEGHTALKHTHYPPAATHMESRPVAPRLRVPLPSPPRMR